jgi:hypothetical protein
MPARPRLIPVLLLKYGVIVRSQLFKVHQVIGNPMSSVLRLGGEHPRHACIGRAVVAISMRIALSALPLGRVRCRFCVGC